MAWTQTNIDVLEKAIATGVLEVQFPDGSRTRYQSTADMLRVRDLMRNSVNSAAGTSRIRQVRLIGSKGLD